MKRIKLLFVAIVSIIVFTGCIGKPTSFVTISSNPSGAKIYDKTGQLVGITPINTTLHSLSKGQCLSDKLISRWDSGAKLTKPFYICGGGEGAVHFDIPEEFQDIQKDSVTAINTHNSLELQKRNGKIFAIDNSGNSYRLQNRHGKIIAIDNNGNTLNLKNIHGKMVMRDNNGNIYKLRDRYGKTIMSDNNGNIYKLRERHGKLKFESTNKSGTFYQSGSGFYGSGNTFYGK